MKSLDEYEQLLAPVRECFAISPAVQILGEKTFSELLHKLGAQPVHATGQDLMLARIGLAEVPTTEPIKCDEFQDHVRVTYCINTKQLNPRFLRIMDEMAKTVGITKTPTSFGSLLKASAILRSTLTLHEWIFP
jgi:hypothetical protein